MAQSRIDGRAARVAAMFWQRIGRRETFPRELEASVLWGLPLGIVKLPRIGLLVVRKWLEERRVFLSLECADRPLRGFLLARRGEGLIFLDGAEADSERRLSLAHEVAHFLEDYLHPREAAVSAFGPSILAVLDGDRPPSPEERLSSVLRSVRLGTYTHFLNRGPAGYALEDAVVEAEDFADRLALELLAPRRAVTQVLSSSGISVRDDGAADAAAGILRGRFGLPPVAAERYAQHILSGIRGSPTFRDWLLG